MTRRINPIRHKPPVSIDPTRQVAYVRSNPIPAAMWIFLILFGLVVIKNGTPPTMAQAGTWALAAVIVVVSATIAPELVTAILLAALVLAVLTNVPLVSEILDHVGTRFDQLTSTIPSFGGGA